MLKHVKNNKREVIKPQSEDNSIKNESSSIIHLSKRRCYKCELCGRHETTRHNLEKHKLSKCSFSCKNCNKSYKFYRGLIEHIKHVCRSTCNTGDRPTYQQHVENGTQSPDPEFECNNCGLKYRYKRGLSRHLRSCGIKAKMKFKCNTCKKEYKRKEELTRHKKFECGIERCFSCPYCTLKLKYKHHLVRHLKTVHEVKV